MPASTVIERPTGIVVPELRHLATTFIDQPEIRDSDAGDGSYTFIGHAAVWNRLSVDLGGFRERILRGAFTSVLDDPTLDVVLVADHGLGALTTVASIRGKTLELSEDAKGLRVYASIAPTSVGADLKILMQRGDVQGMSFGFRVADGGDTWAEENGEVVRTIRSMGALIDVSIVSFPAYPQTDVSVRSILVERRERLDLYDSTSGKVDPDEVARIRSRLESRTLELTPQQQEAFDRAAAALANDNRPEGETVRSIATETDLRHAITHVGRAEGNDQERARIIARAAELDVRGLVPGTWAQDGTVRAGAALAAEQRETYNDIYTALNSALDDLFVDNGDFYYVWVQDFTATDVIFCAGGDLWSAPYTLIPGGTVTIGEPVNVRPVTEYVAMETAGLPAESVESEPPELDEEGERTAARDALERRLRLMKLQAQA
jgi:HK97 family phage prohead protease